jgi:hypothetical protein
MERDTETERRVGKVLVVWELPKIPMLGLLLQIQEMSLIPGHS